VAPQLNPTVSETFRVVCQGAVRQGAAGGDARTFCASRMPVWQPETGSRLEDCPDSEMLPPRSGIATLWVSLAGNSS
jgi:hypothetical protein